MWNSFTLLYVDFFTFFDSYCFGSFGLSLSPLAYCRTLYFVAA
jgi:hypothetical protein